MKKNLSNLHYNINIKVSETRKNPSNTSHSEINIEIKLNKNKSFLFRHQNMLQVKQLLLYIWLYDGPFFFFFQLWSTKQCFWWMMYILLIMLYASAGVSVCRGRLYRQRHQRLALLSHQPGLPHRLPVCYASTWTPGAWQLRLHRCSKALISLIEATFCAPHLCFFKSMQQVRTSSDSDEFLDKPFWRNSFLKV